MHLGASIRNERGLEPSNVHTVETVYAMEKLHRKYRTGLTETSGLENL